MNEHDPDNQFEIVTPQCPPQPEQPRKKRLESRKTECTKCGECCMRGGPVLLREDLALLNSRLSYNDIYTVREGEPQISRHDQETYFASMEFVKIREKSDTPQCLFLDANGDCAVYDQRPMLCRSYKCWAPEEVITGLGELALSRKDLFGSVDILSEIIARHSEKCGYDKFTGAIARINGGDEAAAEELVDMLQYDAYVRPYLTERFNIPAASMEVILGRALSETIEPLGIRIRREGEEYILERIEKKEEEA